MSVFRADLPDQLDRALHSIWTDQIRQPGEVVLVVDGPIPVSLRTVVDVWHDRLGERLQVVELETNVGLGGALNAGLQKCRGKWVARMDADDVAFPERFERQLAYLEAHPDVDVLGTGAVEIDEQGVEGAVRGRSCDHNSIVRSLWASPFIHPSVMFCREKVMELGGYDASLRRRQDYDLWFRAAEHGLVFANLPEPLLWYRFHQATHQKQSPRRAWEQAVVGFRGCRRVGLGWWKGLACFIPFFRSLLPRWVQHWLYRLLQPMDPRR